MYLKGPYQYAGNISPWICGVHGPLIRDHEDTNALQGDLQHPQFLDSKNMVRVLSCAR